MFGHSDPGNNTEVSMPKALQVKCLFVYVLERVQGGLVSTKKSHLEKLQSQPNEIIYIKTFLS